MIIPPLANGVIPISLAARAASIPTDPTVPIPGTVDAAPDANSRPAPTKSPCNALCAAKTAPRPKPTKGIFLPADFAKAPAPIFAAPLTPSLAAALPPYLPAAFAAALPPYFAANRVPTRAAPRLPTACTNFLAPTLLAAPGEIEYQYQIKEIYRVESADPFQLTKTESFIALDHYNITLYKAYGSTNLQVT